MYTVQADNNEPIADSGLFNATQSSTSCNEYRDSIYCQPASNAIDGDWDTHSETNPSNGTHWWKVSMLPQTVDWIKLAARSHYGCYGDANEIKVWD